MDHMNDYSSGKCLAEPVDNRDVTELLRTRAHLLVGVDRTLLDLYIERGSNFHQMAQLAGLSATSVARRIRRIIRRLTGGIYPLCLSQRSQFCELELAIVRDHFVRGLSMARISRNRNISLYRVRATVRKARQCMSAHTRHRPGESYS